MNSDLKEEQLKEGIQACAEKICDFYHLKKSEGIDDIETVIKDEEVKYVFRDLIFSIMKYYKKEYRPREVGTGKDRVLLRAPDSNSYFKLQEIALIAIPRYKAVDDKGKKQPFIHYFGAVYSQNKDSIQDLPDDQALFETEEDVRGRENWGAFGGDSYVEKQARKMYKACANAEVDIDSASEFVVNRVYEIMKRDAQKKGIENRYNRSNIKRYIELLNMFRQFGTYDPMFPSKILDEDREENYYDDSDNRMVQYLTYAAELVKDFVQKKDKKMIRCLYTNKVANYFRTLVDSKPDGEYWDDADKEEQRLHNTDVIVDDYGHLEKMLFDSVLFVDYLKHVLEDPEPRTLRNVCLNEYREENGVKRKFTDTSIESFEGMSKGSVNKTYRPKFEEMNRILREYIDGKR